MTSIAYAQTQTQTQTQTSETYYASGRVVTPGADAMRPVPNVWVTLHRVGRDTAGPVDSVRTSATGAYRIPYHHFGASDAIYFTATVYDGIAYFSAPLRVPHPSEPDAEITVFDTTSRPIPISVQGHHVIVSRPNPSGERSVTEVFELLNDTSVTRIAVGDAPSGASWSWMLPEANTHPSVLQSDFPADAVKFAEGHALIYAPMSPGLKQFAYTYMLPNDAFPLSLPLLQPTSILEVLVEEPQAKVTGARLNAKPDVAIDGRPFHRYLASDVPANAVIQIGVPEAEHPINSWYVVVLTVVIGGAMVGALVWAMRRR